MLCTFYQAGARHNHATMIYEPLEGFMPQVGALRVDERNEAIYQQVVGAGMGTSISMVYAKIFMIWLETPIFQSKRFRSCIQLYKLFTDDLFIVCTGSVAKLC
jgi:hypothetical protein